MAHTIDVHKLGSTLALAISLAGLVGGFAVASYRIEKVEIAQAEDRRRIEAIESGQHAMILDIALLCANVVAQNGGDPHSRCHTMGAKR
jgi:hypothetical protein